MMIYLHRIKTRLTAMLPSDPVHAIGMLCVYVLLCLPAAFVAWCAIDFGAS